MHPHTVMIDEMMMYDHCRVSATLMQWQLLLPMGPTVCFSSAANLLQLCLIMTWSKFVINVICQYCMITAVHKQMQLGIKAKLYLVPMVLLQLITFWCMHTRCNKLEPCQVHVINCKAGKIGGVYSQAW